MPFDPTTAPEPVIDGDPVVNLPEKPNYTSRQPSLVDNIRPHVQLPQNPIPARGRTATDFDSLDPRQCSAVDTRSVVTVCLPKAAELPQAGADKLPETVRLFLFRCQHMTFPNISFGTGTATTQFGNT